MLKIMKYSGNQIFLQSKKNAYKNIQFKKYKYILFIHKKI